MTRWLLGCCLSLIGCDALLSNNPANCVINAGACTASQFCNQVTQRCETLDCTVNPGLCGPQEYCDPGKSRCALKDCVVDASLCAADQRCNAAQRACETVPFVIGQASPVLNSGVAYGMSFPQGVLLVPIPGNPSQSRLVVADSSNRRVLIWNTVPTQNRPADAVLGVPDTNTLSPFGPYGGANEGSLLSPGSLASDGTRLSVGDSSGNRILTWDQIPSQPLASGPIPANRVWGQPNYQSTQADSGQQTPNASGVNIPSVFLESGAASRFFISDTANHRVLVFPSFPINPQTQPKFVLGQTTFTSAAPATSAANLSSPGQVFSDGNELFVPDTGSNRVLVFDLAALLTGAAAKVVIGQVDFVSGAANRGALPGPGTLSAPLAATVVSAPQRQLFVADRNNHRVLRYTLSTPTAAVNSADLVLGQANAGSGLPNRGGPPGLDTLRSPVSVSSDGTRLAVCDNGNNRVLLWLGLPTQSGQPADVVLGQPDALSAIPDNPPTRGALNLIRPTHVSTDGTRLLVVDSGNHRVLIWNQLPQSGTQPPDVVLGQSDFSRGAPNGGLVSVTPTGMSVPFAAAVENGRLAVTDNGNHRVLIWNQIPTRSNQPADLCLGQPDCMSAVPKTAANGLYNPSGVRFSGSRLWVVDTSNSRVLAFDNPSSSGAPATLAVGQPGLASGVPNIGGQSARTLAYPRAVAIDSGRLLIADHGNHRALIWNKIPTQSGVPADVVVGQADFANSYTRPSRSRLENPTDLLVFRGSLYLASELESRILYFAQVPKQNGQPADRVLGQPDFVSTLPNNPDVPVEERMIGPVALAAVGNRLLIADYNHSRVLVRGLAE